MVDGAVVQWLIARLVARWLWAGWLLAEFAVHSGVGILGAERLHSLLSGRKLEGRTTNEVPTPLKVGRYACQNA